MRRKLRRCGAVRPVGAVVGGSLASPSRFDLGRWGGSHLDVPLVAGEALRERCQFCSFSTSTARLPLPPSPSREHSRWWCWWCWWWARAEERRRGVRDTAR